MHVTPFDFLSSSEEIVIELDGLFWLFLTSNMFIMPMRLPVRICNVNGNGFVERKVG